tara:strand:+ start:10509 stop:11792 length:1284 start_codon:yes stop_codon:yes gene_type:complete
MTTVKYNESTLEVINKTTTYTTDTLTPTNVVHNTTSLRLAIAEYQSNSYKLLSNQQHINFRSELSKSRCTIRIHNAWFKPKPTDELADKCTALVLHDYQQLIFSDPLAHGTLPIIDNIAFTLDVSDKQLKKLKCALKTKNFIEFKLKKSGPTFNLKNNQERYTDFAMFSFGKGKLIMLYWGLSDPIRTARPKQRLMKVSFNPARFTSEEVTRFFTWLKESKVFNYRKVIRNANVTRIDTALDLFGFHLCNLIINKPQVNIIEYVENISCDGEVVVGTVKLGSPKDSNLTAYDKQHKIVEVNHSEIPLITYRNGDLVAITRIERKYKPADGKPIPLKNLDNAPYFLTDVRIYSPTILRELTSKERSIVRTNGFADWLFVQCSDERREFINELLPQFPLYVNHGSLHSAQNKQLVTLTPNLNKVVINTV